MPIPNRIPKLTDPTGNPTFDQHYSQLIDALNSVLGHNGPVQLASDLDMGGKKIRGVGPPTLDSDVVTQAYATSKYSAEALRPQLEGNGANSLKSPRRLNDKNQREQSSSFLNDLMSTPPNANGIYPVLTNVMGGVQVDIPASTFTFSDGSQVNLMAYTHIVALPASYSIISISSSGNTVTAVLSSPPPVSAGGVLTIDGVVPGDFNGTFVLTSVSGSTITYQKSIGTLVGVGGTAFVNGVYYFAVKRRQNRIFLLGPFSGDTAQNRQQANFDGFQIVAVVVVTADGGQVALSGGGGSPILGSPTAGAFF